MKRLSTILMILFLVGCSRAPTMDDICTYGEQRFIDEVLAVADGKSPSEELMQAFSPLRIESHLNGAWLVYKESSRYQAGVYVDRKTIEGWGGSGMEVSPWSERIAWTREKIRR